MLLEALVKQLNERGVQVVWRAQMWASGWWVPEASMLILSAAHPAEEQEASCRDVLVLTDRLAVA